MVTDHTSMMRQRVLTWNRSNLPRNENAAAKFPATAFFRSSFLTVSPYSAAALNAGAAAVTSASTWLS
jgi:hypothetical protein